MTSTISDANIMVSSGIANIYRNNSQTTSLASPLYSCSATDNVPFSLCNNVNVNTNHDSSNLFTLRMLNQALNLNVLAQNHQDKSLQMPSLQFPDIQKVPANRFSNICNPQNLTSEYQKLKQIIDKSGLLSPNENLITKNRGECYWSNCYFQSDIEETFKRHVNDCHQLTSSALAQLEISLEKSLYLSSMLLKEQNYLYNMLKHLDYKLKNLPPETPSLIDPRYLAILLNRLKQAPNTFDVGLSCTDLSSSPYTVSHSSSHNHQPHLHPHIHSHHHHLFPPPRFSPTHHSPNLSLQLIDSLSSAILQTQPLPSPTTNCYQSVTKPNLSFTASILPPTTVIKTVTMTSNAIDNGQNTSPTTIPDIENNFQDLPFQTRLPDSNYPRSCSVDSNHTDDKTNCIRRSQSDDQGHPSNSMTDREYYRQYTVRPSISYVNLIKTAILESPRRELSLNEIYVWMQSEFAYFRDKEQKWKNAIRHNLSLHKCFQRKHGKLWTFNEKEYSLKKSRNRFQYNVPIPVSETLNVNGYDDYVYDGLNVNHREDAVKKEYDDENNAAESGQEWSQYCVHNAQKSDPTSSMLPNMRASSCPISDT